MSTFNTIAIDVDLGRPKEKKSARFNYMQDFDNSRVRGSNENSDPRDVLNKMRFWLWKLGSQT